MRSLRCILLALSICGAVAADGAVAEAREGPWDAVAELRELMDWVTFRLTFDGGTMLPEMAAGEWEPQVTGTPRFELGLVDQALLAGSGSGRAYYPRGPNAPMGTRGAVSMWIRPVKWTRVNGGNTTFLMTTNSSFYLQRQGPAHNEEGRVTRHEGLQYLIRGERTGNKTLMVGTAGWPDGQWRLIVANWSWPTMSLSIDGGEFRSVAVKAAPDESYFGRLSVGATGGETTLIDELTIYRRPLTLDEARLLYESFRPAGEDQQ
ncbi:MAG: LamG-like jellyroll fold domain-containing protein [Armatimonadota bacterium]|nr:LamG-like jellyroll fold domain-containing protein [Armatimonadota bacterium]